jgi:hypothetical protein
MDDDRRVAGEAVAGDLLTLDCIRLVQRVGFVVGEVRK